MVEDVLNSHTPQDHQREMIRLAPLNRLPRDGGVAGMVLSTVPARRVINIYEGQGFLTAVLQQHPGLQAGAVEPTPQESVEFAAFVEDAWQLYGNDTQAALHGHVVTTSGHTVFVFDLCMDATLAWARLQQHPQLSQMQNVRIDDLNINPRPPVEVSGQLQYMFRVGPTYRGVAAVARVSIGILVARCLIGLEMIASMAPQGGPLFASAFNGTTWCVLVWPARALPISRTRGRFDLRDQATVTEFVCNLRVAMLLAVEHEYP